MAIEFGKNRTQDFAPENVMSFGKSFSRMGAQPLDMNEVWYDLDALKNYAKTNDTAYVGMCLTYVNSKDGTVTIYAIKNTAGDLVEIATDIEAPEIPKYSGEGAIEVVDSIIKVLVDDDTIKIVDNKLVANIPEDKDTKTKVRSADNYINVNGDFIENSENEFTISINETALKQLIGSETTAAMEFKGATSILPENAFKGDIYKASDNIMVPAENDAEGNGFTTSIGDSIVADADGKWYLIPSGDDIEDTWRPVTNVGSTATLTFNANNKLDVTVAEDGTITYSHASINAPQLVEGGSGRTYITELVSDGFGHITGYKVATESDQEIPEYEDHNDTYSAGNGIDISNDGNESHTVKIKLAENEANLVVNQSGLATNFDLNEYVTKEIAGVNNEEKPGIRFINQEEINKLSALSLDGEDVTISGSVEATQVKGLYAVIKNIVTNTPGTEDFDSEVEGVQQALGIEIGAQKNYIDEVSTDFQVVEGKLLLANSYVTTGIYQSEVGDLNALIRTKGENSTLVEEINAINERLTWVEISSIE